MRSEGRGFIKNEKHILNEIGIFYLDEVLFR